MARPRRSLALAFALAALVPPAAAAPQGLRTLHVDALSMRADRTQLQVGQVFHLAIHARVREQIAALDELVVPNVGTMQLEGDERHVASSPAGTDVVETLTLEPTQPGTFTFSGAYVDAIDARTGKPSRFSANPVRVVVAAPSVVSRLAYPSPLELLVGFVLIITVLLAAIGLPIALVLVRRPRAAALPSPAPAPPPRPRTARDDVADALRAYRSAPGNGALLRVRAALFTAAGVPAGSTLRDALRTTADPGLRQALMSAERAAFGEDAQRDRFAAEMIEATEAWLR